MIVIVGIIRRKPVLTYASNASIIFGGMLASVNSVKKVACVLIYVGFAACSSDPSNYRPISLTSTICKVMESIIRDHIMDFFFFKITTLVKISSGLLRADPLHYNCYALWMNGQHS